MSIISTTEFLKKDQAHYITLSVLSSEKIIGKKETFFADIPNGDLATYIKFSLGIIPPNEKTRVSIQWRKVDGEKSIKKGYCAVDVQPDNYIEVEQRSSPVIYNPSNMPPPVQQSFLGHPDMGLGFPAVLDLHNKASKLDDKIEQLADLKKEYADLKQQFNILDVDLREAKSKLSISEAQKEMAVMLAKSETKSFLDSDGVKTLLEKAPEIFQGLAAMKGGLPAQAASALGNPSSAVKGEFFDYVNELTDQQINWIGGVCHFINDAQFVNQIASIIAQKRNAAV